MLAGSFERLALRIQKSSVGRRNFLKSAGAGAAALVGATKAADAQQPAAPETKPVTPLMAREAGTQPPAELPTPSISTNDCRKAKFI
jgi:hypothetical protein